MKVRLKKRGVRQHPLLPQNPPESGSEQVLKGTQKVLFFGPRPRRMAGFRIWGDTK